MDNNQAVERENERQTNITETARTETLAAIGVQDEYFDEPLTEKQKDEIAFREKMISDYQGKRRATETMRRECEVLGQSTTWEDGKLLEIDHIINILTEQINGIKFGKI